MSSPIQRPAVLAKLPPTSAAHQPFSFLHSSLQHDPGAQFVAVAMYIAQGVKLCLEMANSSTLARAMNLDADAGEEDLPLLDVTDTDRIMRLAAAAAHLLATHAEKHIEWLNEHRSTAKTAEGGAA